MCNIDIEMCHFVDNWPMKIQWKNILYSILGLMLDVVRPMYVK